MGPLQGIRVMDFLRMVNGAEATRMLAAFGAEVIRVEWPEGSAADPVRTGQYNLDKLSITMNMKRPEAIQLAKRLAAISDIFAENMRPSTVPALGLSYETLKEVKPDLIYLSMSGWGQTGPKREWSSLGAAAAAHGGVTFLTGLPGRPAAGPNTTIGDDAPPWLATGAILAALRYRRRTGKGMYIDMAQTQSQASFMKMFYLDRSVNGRTARRPDFPPGNRRDFPPSAPHNAFPCTGENSWCAITVTTNRQWEGLKKAMNDPDWCDDKRFSDPVGRYQCHSELEAKISEWTRSFDRFYLASLLQEHGVPAGPVETPMDLAEFDTQLAHRGTWQIYEHPERGPGRFKVLVPKLSKSPYQPKRSIPQVGEDCLYVYHELLGLSDMEIEELAAKDVIRLPSMARRSQ